MNENQKTNTTDTIDNPCIRHCCLDEHDICVGCFRSYEEILAWHSMAESEKIHTKALALERQLLKTSIVGKFTKPD